MNSSTVVDNRQRFYLNAIHQTRRGWSRWPGPHTPAVLVPV